MPLRTSHKRSFKSSLPCARIELLLGSHWRHVTKFREVVFLTTSLEATGSHIRTVVSREPLAKALPSVFSARADIVSVWPSASHSSFGILFPLLNRQISATREKRFINSLHYFIHCTLMAMPFGNNR